MTFPQGRACRSCCSRSARTRRHSSDRCRRRWRWKTRCWPRSRRRPTLDAARRSPWTHWRWRRAPPLAGSNCRLPPPSTSTCSRGCGRCSTTGAAPRQRLRLLPLELTTPPRSPSRTSSRSRRQTCTPSRPSAIHSTCPRAWKWPASARFRIPRRCRNSPPCCAPQFFLGS